MMLPNGLSHSPQPPATNYQMQLQVVNMPQPSSSAPPPNIDQIQQIQQQHNIQYNHMQGGDHNHLSPDAKGGGYGIVSAPTFNRKQQHQQDDSDSDNANIS